MKSMLISTVRSRLLIIACLVVMASALFGPSVNRAIAATSNAPITGMVATSSGTGYWQVASDGGVFAYGNAGFYGSMGGKQLSAPVIGIAKMPGSAGYWLAARDGGVFAFGNASFYGSMDGKHLSAPVVGIAATPTGKGYWLVASDGGIFAFGDAGFHGSLPQLGVIPTRPVVGIASSATGKGYWLTAADGGVFAFGDVGFFGSMGGKPLSAPVTGIATTGSGRGYWLTAADGGIFAFGDAPFLGSVGGKPLNGPVVGIAALSTNDGYWEVASDGGIFAFGAARYLGSMPYVGVPQQPQPNDLRSTIVKHANIELSRGIIETPTNCNWYSSYWKRPCEAWCADFAAYVWKMANAKTDGLDAGAISFYRYGQTNRTFKKSNPQPGDAIVFATNTSTAKHVGIVVKVNSPTSITMISGNSGPKTDRVTSETVNLTQGRILGFVSPVSN